ncbi:MAG TPA: SOS response-associated peptidase [Steroidobacteraceae bacterium]|nr:SOS response-associated peptidase [Steroidobacteraceae bacterium]
MCGRFAFYSPHEAVVQLFGLPADTPEIEPQYNIAPTSWIPVVRQSPDVAATRQLAMMYWGLVPSWAKDRSIGARMINARAETLQEKPAFRHAFRLRRGLVPADGYFEWMKAGGRDKQPYLIRPASGAPFALAAIWETWRDPATGEPLVSCSLVTTDASRSVAHIHDRMPVIIPGSAFAQWLDPHNRDVEGLARLFAPDAAGALVATPVSRSVSNARNQGPECIEPMTMETPGLPFDAPADDSVDT